jgi:hypothetical protein
MADTVVARSAPVAPEIAASTQTWQWVLAFAGMVLVLISPALWNGFPLIFPDTGGYLTRPIEGALGMGRSALYGFLLYISIPFAFWPVVLAQAALTAWIVVLTMRALSLGGRPWLALAAVLLLALGTSLAWLAAQLMPDIFFPAAVLALYLLAFRLDSLATWERIGLVAVIAVAIASHMAALGLCIGLVAVLWVAARVMRLPRPRLRYTVAAAAAGVALALLSNFAIAQSFRFTPGGANFLFGRLVEDGIVARYLAERCPDPDLRICAYAREIPDHADDWLWGPDTAFYKLGGDAGFGGEAREIIVETLKRYPLAHVAAALTAAAQQFVTFATEVSSVDNHPAVGTIAEHTPQLLAPVMAARQQRGHFDTFALNLVHVPVAALGIVGVAAAFAFRRRLALNSEAAALCLTVLLALTVNAAICGVFSHPVDRYQSRLVLLAPLALGLVLVARRRTPQA